MAEPDAELEAEQAYVNHAYDCLDHMRTRAGRLPATAAGDWVSGEILHHTLQLRQLSLRDDGRALCFGRIDERAGDTWYIGRRHVEDAQGDPVVVEWRAPVAVPFYRASHAQPHGLARRRQFTVEGRHLLAIADEDFAAEPAAAGDGRAIRGRDALIRELDRARTGEMRDIVATIQAEQDEIIRSSQEGILVVQGGPGTGKTAVGLHRAAFLLYGNEALERAGVLVVGPNRTFLRYIAQVLPSLDVAAVAQVTTRDLVSGIRLRALDPLLAARVKGDARMAAVLSRALANRRRRPDADLELRLAESRRIVIEADRLTALHDDLVERRVPHNLARDALRESLLRQAHDRYLSRYRTVGASDFAEAAQQVRADGRFNALLDRMWPRVSSLDLVRDLLSNGRRLAAAAAGVLSPEEQQAIVRPPAARVDDEPWTDADVALVDEARFLVEGRPPAFGHIVVDEAQDLSPMQLRMLARRCPSGSMTILGDIAQGTGVWAHDDWSEVLEHLPAPKGVRRSDLILGYRAPAQVIELACRLLPVAAPQVPPVEAVRPGPTDPVLARVERGGLLRRAVSEAAYLSAEHRSVALVVANRHLRDVRAALGRAGVDFGEAARDGLDRPVTLLPAAAAKGLEFDAVVLVEPAAVVEDAPKGLRLLYVCMTRATKHLSIIHAESLPEPLAA